MDPASVLGDGEKKTIFVVGLGMVGIAFIEKLLNLDEAQRYRIVTCGEETHLAYNRVALTDYLQHRSAEKLYLNQADWYAQYTPSRFQFHTGESVISVNTAAHSVTTSKGRSIAYDTCVLATGSQATYPPYCPPSRAHRTKGVFVYRNIADLDSIINYSESTSPLPRPSSAPSHTLPASDGNNASPPSTHHATIIGGGLLGLEAAKALSELSAVSKVTILNRQAYPLSRQLDADGGEIVLKRLRSLGVEVQVCTSVRDLVTVPLAAEGSDSASNPSEGDTSEDTKETEVQERLTGLLLSTNEVLPSSIVIFAIGITPRDDLARSSDLTCIPSPGSGVIVDDLLQTSAPDVYAIGECASWRGQTYGLIGPGVEMADILSFNLTQTSVTSPANPSRSSDSSRENKGMSMSFRPRKMNNPDLSTKLKLMGVDVASYGDYFAEKRQAERTKGRVRSSATLLATAKEETSEKPTDDTNKAESENEHTDHASDDGSGSSTTETSKSESESTAASSLEPEGSPSGSTSNLKDEVGPAKTIESKPGSLEASPLSTPPPEAAASLHGHEYDAEGAPSTEFKSTKELGWESTPKSDSNPPSPLPSSIPLKSKAVASNMEKSDQLDDQRSSRSRAKVWETTSLVTSNLTFPAPSQSNEAHDSDPNKPIRRPTGHRRRAPDDSQAEEPPIECLVYRDPFAGVYKKYIFSADGKYLLGGMMVGDTSDYVKMVALVKKKKPLDVPPSQFILGSRAQGEEDGADLDGDTQICSCHNVSKDDISNCVKNGATALDAIKQRTKAGTGCGGCLPLVTNIFKSEMKKSGHELTNHLCPHFPLPRTELFTLIKIKKLRTFEEVMRHAGTLSSRSNPETRANGGTDSDIPLSIGCEICKPAVGSILSSLWNEHVMLPSHHQNQDTNDRYLANIQRNGTFSVIPRIAAGEITPEKLMVLGQVAKKYGLYTKITGGQRIDLFGAQKPDLPDIWEELITAGFESGHAYGKALRTVKSCVGTTWCRYGIGDSVGLAVQLEERYKGIRSPHKLKGGVSGCVRECAEAQSKDFGLIATDKGWNIFIGGNGGANPRHATLFAKDVPPSKVIRIIDRFLMYYIQTADKLMRTARWVEQFGGGVERLKKILLDDELSICTQLEQDMDELVGTFQCEWTTVVNTPEKRKQFRQFVNTEERRPHTEVIAERGQERPADWPKEFPPLRMSESDISLPKDKWEWRLLADVSDLMPTDVGTTSAAVKYGESQLSIFHIPKRGYFATQQMCPHKRAFVLDHGIIGDDKDGNLYVSCPLHKRNFKLADGLCLNDDQYSIISFEVKEENGKLFLLLPDEEILDSVLASSKWMVKKATAEAYGRSAATQVEIVGPDGRYKNGSSACNTTEIGSSCGDGKLDW